MISWLQTNLQKHFRFVFIILLGVVIVAFVFTIGAAPGIGDGRNRIDNLSFFGYELNSEAQRQEFFNDAFYSALLQFGGAQMMNQDQLNQYAFNRATALHLADLHDVPGPTADQLTEHIQTLGMFLGADGQFSREAYASFRDETRAAGRISEGALSQIMSDDYRVNRIYDVLSSPGFVMNDEVLDELAADQTQWSINVATFDFENFSPEIDTSEEKLQEFFASNDFRYTSPARRVISYIEFKAASYMDAVEVDENELKNFFARNASNYTKTVTPEAKEGETEAPEPETVPATFDESKSQVTADFKLEQARLIAQSKAEELALGFFEADNATGPDDSLDKERLEAIVTDRGYEARQTTPFARNETPLGLSWTPNLVAQSYSLSENHIYSQPVVEGDSTFVLYLQLENPEFIPSFKTVENRVKEDYTQEETRRLRTVHGEELATALKSTADSDAFKGDAEAKGMAVAEYVDFTRREPAEGLDTSLLFSIADMAAGDVSDAIIREDKGTIIQVVSKSVPEVSAEGEEFDSRMTMLQANYERFAVAQYISKLAGAELARAGLATAN